MPGTGVPRGHGTGPGGSDGTAASDRVLVLVEGRSRIRRAVLEPLAEQLARGRPALRIEVRSDPTGLLRIVRSHPRSLSGYAAVVVLTVDAPLRRRASRGSLGVAELAGVAVPTLVVRTGRPLDRRPVRSGPRSRPATGYEVLELDADPTPAGAAGRIAVTVRAMLLRRGPRPTSMHDRPEPVVVTSTAAPQLDPAAADRLGRIARMTRDAFDLAVAEVNLLDEREVITIASAGGTIGRTARADALCDLAVASPGLTIIPDTRLDPRARTRRSARGAGAVRFYAGHPIASSRGEVIGTLCVHDPAPQEPEELDLGLLRDLAMLVEGELMDARRRIG